MSLHIFGGIESIRFFPDNPDAVLPFIGHRHVEYGGEQYQGLIKEMQEYGAGAYITVNGTDGVGAKAENINRVRTYYVDIDGLKNKTPALTALITAKLKPSAIVETKNGVHAYWYAANQTPVDHEEYRRVQLGLIKAFGGDTSAKDIARVLRIPDTWHLKDPGDPFLVRIVHQLPSSKTPYYTAQQILDAYPSPYRKAERPEVKVTDSPRAWGLYLEDLGKWNPVPGERNSTMLLSAGVAIAFGVPVDTYVNTMYPVVKEWNTGRNVYSELRRVADWAYTKGNPIPPQVLRRRGVPIRSSL
jgi:hypothetical protein